MTAVPGPPTLRRNIIRAAPLTSPHFSHGVVTPIFLPEIDLAPVSSSGIRCTAGHFFDRTSSWFSASRQCSCGELEDRDYLALMTEVRHYIEDASTVRTVTWWHSSTQPELSFINLPMSRRDWLMHVGSVNAALTRASEGSTRRHDRYYLHELGLRPNYPIHEDVIREDQSYDSTHELMQRRATESVVRYINQQEDAGSISLAGPRSAFAPVQTLDITNMLAPVYRKDYVNEAGNVLWRPVT